MAGTAIVEQIVAILVAGLTSLGEGIGQGVNDFVSALTITGTGENAALSPYFVMVLVFAGVALAIGLTRRIFSWLETLGGSN